MNLTAIETSVKSALDTAGLVNVLTQQHYTASQDKVAELYMDRDLDPVRLSYMVVTVKRTGSERFASCQVLELGKVDVEIFLAINEKDNTEALMRQRVDTVVDTLDTLFTYSDEVDRTFAPIATDHVQTNVKGFTCFKALVSQAFEKPKTVVYV